MIIERALAYLLIVLGASLVFASGCSWSYGDHTLALLHLPPSNHISTRTVTVIGAELQPSQAGLRVGYVRSVENSTPVGSLAAPDVGITTQFDPDGTIRETYAVGQLQ